MLGFKQFLSEQFLVEGRGEETAHSGFANEHFTVQHINDYVKHVKSGGTHESGLKKIKSTKFDHTSYKEGHPVHKAIKSMGKEEVGKIHEDSKDTAHTIIHHLRNEYGLSTTNSHHVGKVGPAGEEEVKKLTGKPSNADVVINTKSAKGKAGQALAHLEHIGASLKYSKKPSSAIKIHSPSITHMGEIVDSHHEQMHGKKLGIVDNMNKAVKKGLSAQQNVIKTHARELDKHFKSKDFQNELKNSAKAKKYGSLAKTATKENLEKGQLSSAGVSYIRNSDKFKHVYNKMGEANLKMKSEVAAHLHQGVAAVLNHKSKSPKHAAIKESLVRSMGNIHKPGSTNALPTFLVSTNRGKKTEIHDVTNHFEKHFKEKGVDGNTSMTKGTSLFKAGPMTVTVDARPATRGNPLSGPINASVPTSELKKK